MQAIITKYLSPTNSNGARVRARCQARSLTLHWDHSLGQEANHHAAARALAADLHWTGEWVSGGLPDGTGYCYVCRSGDPAFALLTDGEA